MVSLNKKTVFIMAMAMVLYIITLSIFDLQLCMFKSTTGIPCPGCGLTRASLDLLHFDLSSSIHHHALAIPVLMFIGLFVLTRLENLSIKGLVLFLAIFIGYYIIRMLIFFPNELPMDFDPNALIPRLLRLFKK